MSGPPAHYRLYLGTLTGSGNNLGAVRLRSSGITSGGEWIEMTESHPQTDQEDDLRIIFGLMEDRQELREAALGDLLRKHGGTIKGMVWAKFGNALQEDEVHDVLIRTATKAWRYAASFDDRKASLGTWLVAIALREAADVLKENTPEFGRIDDEDSVEDCLSDADATDDSEAETKKDDKLFRDLQTVITSLPPLQRAVIEADLACGGTADAERLAKSHGTTKNSIYVSRVKAKKRIETEMTKLGHFEPAGNVR